MADINLFHRPVEETTLEARTTHVGGDRYCLSVDMKKGYHNLDSLSIYTTEAEMVTLLAKMSASFAKAVAEAKANA